MAKKAPSTAVVATPVEYVNFSAPVKAWQFNSVEQLTADLKKSRIKSIEFSVDQAYPDGIVLNGNQHVAAGEWIVYWPKDKFCTVFPEKFFKKHFADASVLASEPTCDSPEEVKAEPIVEPTLTVRNVEPQEVVLASDDEPGQRIVLEEKEEADANDNLGEFQMLSFVSAISEILDGEDPDAAANMKAIKKLMKDLTLAEKHAIGTRINKKYGRKLLSVGGDFIEAPVPKKKPNERIPGRASAHAIPSIIVNRRVSVMQ